MCATARFEHLAAPIDLGSVRLKNRMMKNSTFAVHAAAAAQASS
ncbi:MAG: hypothetical protein ACOYBY_16085 [Dermatophilaceae bacterium]